MARISLSVCDFCKKTTTDELEYKLIVVNDETTQVNAEICNACYNTISNQIKQEAQPVFPGAAPSTPSEQGESPVLSSYLEGQREQGEPTGELLDGEVQVIKSNFTQEKRRQVVAELANKCSHPRGFSMDEDGKGIKCKDCGEKASF